MYARVIITVRDYNDHAPQFLASLYNGTVTETAAIGTSVVEVVAVDRDKGANGHIMYSIISGTVVGGVVKGIGCVLRDSGQGYSGFRVLYVMSIVFCEVLFRFLHFL